MFVTSLQHEPHLFIILLPCIYTYACMFICTCIYMYKHVQHQLGST